MSSGYCAACPCGVESGFLFYMVVIGMEDEMRSIPIRRPTIMLYSNLGQVLCPQGIALLNPTSSFAVRKLLFYHCRPKCYSSFFLQQIGFPERNHILGGINPLQGQAGLLASWMQFAGVGLFQQVIDYCALAGVIKTETIPN